MNIIAYGSLLNKDSLIKTLGRNTELRPVTLPGMSRLFNAPFSGYSFCNLKPDPGNKIRAAYFTINAKELAVFAEREAGSAITEVLPGYFAFVWPERFCRNLPVLQSYLDVCETGAAALGLNFWLGTVVPEIIVQDRQNPLYTA